MNLKSDISDIVIKWYDKNGRDLPWREQSKTPFLSFVRSFTLIILSNRFLYEFFSEI